MITAEQAWDLTINDRKLKEVERAIIHAALLGKHECELNCPLRDEGLFKYSYGYIVERLERNGFSVSRPYDSLMRISW